MHGYPHPDHTASELARLPLDEARAKLAEILSAPFDMGATGQAFATGLQFNALLVTRLRERAVIWGNDT